ncbi:methionine-rich copper-binding protein CopC [Agromyces cerinus]|uniref:copper resistance CopC family protein n=1 Tax=Agromyces cerinus TaxID=33878 RepID=UPI00195EEFD9|nr:copper resistance CopC family protein [Agromyces cerinus]MBM7832865.1 methionine-rich copper-binding protein CopC [Agromyces cerinus]
MNTQTTAVAATTTDRTTRLRAMVLAAAALTVAAGITLAGASPAFAHDELVGSSPEPGQVFDTAPTEAALDFSNDIIEVGTAIVVVDHHGGDVEVGDPVIAGAHVTAALPANLEGEYQVRWRAVSSDGHPIEGTIDFGVGADATGVWAEESAHDDAATETEHADGGDHEADETAQSGPDGWAVAGFVVGGLGILALIAAVILNAKRKSAGPGAGSGDGSGSGNGTSGTSGTSGDDA